MTARTLRNCNWCGKEYKGSYFNYCGQVCSLNDKGKNLLFRLVPCSKAHTPKKMKKGFKSNCHYTSQRKKLYAETYGAKKVEFNWSAYLKLHPELIDLNLFGSPKSFYYWVGRRYRAPFTFNFPVERIITDRRKQLKEGENKNGKRN